MKVIPSLKNNYLLDQLFKPAGFENRNGEQSDFNVPDLELVNNVVDEKSLLPNNILTTLERATLHMLFGSEKPAEMTFYNRTTVHQIHKGELLDLTG